MEEEGWTWEARGELGRTVPALLQEVDPGFLHRGPPWGCPLGLLSSTPGPVCALPSPALGHAVMEGLKCAEVPWVVP